MMTTTTKARMNSGVSPVRQPMATSAINVTASVANLVTVVSATAANPLIKVASFGYGMRRAAAARRHADEEHDVRAELKRRRKAERAAR